MAHSGSGRPRRPPTGTLVAGAERADSWATDAHKTLNVPYDSGIAIVANAEAMYAAMGVHAAYLIQDERPDPFSTVPEFSRRARGFTVWAALAFAGPSRGGRDGRAVLCTRPQVRRRTSQMEGVRVVNDVVFTQVCVSFGSDEVTREVAARLLQRWHRMDDTRRRGTDRRYCESRFRTGEPRTRTSTALSMPYAGC